MISIDQIAQNIEIIDDINDKYQYIIELGKKLPTFPKEKFVDENVVSGCMSMLWLSVDLVQKENNTYRISLDLYSDSHIVRGILYIVKSIYDGKSLNEIEKIEALKIFKRLELVEYLSQKRKNGLHIIVDRIKKLAHQHSINHAGNY
ncbi:MAG: hypothetical protein C4617_04270 [Candidatus Liberibacter europaeus]|uniref:Fe-S metabolism associated domain-containing protein n=1 Tax=Candidatus Liberibacter europaeus TaxID=744859 RepID=A0A2T4VXA8_9HYPH|nr:hypothetical protein [Candidatus Liberibacter europaeus]PTL86419.1 MAG: hypothetical protein C4617_04270 [Candidatus Liberibacter europaeus]